MTAADTERQGARRQSGVRAMVGISTFVIAVAGLYFARPVFAPLSFALLVIALLWPLQRRLQSVMPKLVALVVSMLATIVVLGALGSMVAWGFRRVGTYVLDNAARLQSLYAQLAGWLEGHDIVLASVWAEHFNMAWILRLAHEITNWLNGALTFSVVVLIYVILGLLEVDDVAARLRALKRADFGRLLFAGSLRTAGKFRRYMLVRTLMSVITGVAVWAFTAAVGLDLAAEWGVIAFALNYIPFLGSLVATVFPTLLAVAQFESWQMALFVFASLNVIQFMVGSYFEPRVLGSALSISPTLSLFAVFFWTFLWGMAGAFIGVPILIAALAFCEEHPASAWVAVLLGDQSGKSPQPA